MSIFTEERERRADAAIEAQRQAAKRTRDESLNAITHTFPDGSVVQVRPSDLSNFQLAIAQGVGRKWVMEDNTTRTTTVAELQAAMASGIAQGEAIWGDYIDALDALNA